MAYSNPYILKFLHLNQAKTRTKETHTNAQPKFMQETFKYHFTNRPAVEEELGGKITLRSKRIKEGIILQHSHISCALYCLFSYLTVDIMRVSNTP